MGIVFEGAIWKLLMALNGCLVLAACNHLSEQGGPTTTQEYDDNKGDDNGGGY